MEHKGTKEITSERLLLRKFNDADSEEMFRNWANDKDVTRFLSWEPHGTIGVTQSMIDSWMNEYENLNFYHWAIVFNGNLIGSIGLLNPNDDNCEAEAGYCMSKTYWGKGIMPEALSLVLFYAFQEIGFKRIFAKHDVENPNSGKVMKKCNMHFIERKNAPLALKPDKVVLCDCYDILNPNLAG